MKQKVPTEKLKEKLIITKFLSLGNSKYEKEISEILKAKIMINGGIHLISDDGRKVDLANSSSGQQEIFYILLLLSRTFC